MSDSKTQKTIHSSDNIAVQNDRNLLIEAQKKGPGATLGAFIKLSGPGWLQSAITLGGGSLAGSLYLGVLGGFSLLWLQPMAMIMGVIMLSAIGYVTLSTGERPFQAINRHVNPVLGWGWALATLMANLVWAMPQFSLGTAAIRQNLFPGLLGGDGVSDSSGKLIVCIVLLVICGSVVWFYDKGNKGIKIFETLLKIMVAIIVISFFGVVIKMSFSEGGLHWGEVLSGFVPDFRLLSAPAETFSPFISAVDVRFQAFWSDMIVAQQRDVMITAAATAVGINMTFLLPYSMQKRGWDKNFRGLAIFDLVTGMFIPFVLATSCVVIASASQFHTQAAEGFLGETDENGALIQPAGNLVGDYNKLAEARLRHETGDTAFGGLTDELKIQGVEALPVADKRMCAMLVQRDSFNLADSLAPLTGSRFSQYVFGIGVAGMAMSTIIILMLINGFVVCEILNLPMHGWPYRIGCLLPGIGILGPFFWTRAAFWLAVPTSVFGMMLLPIAYFTFFLLMNQKSLLGDHAPRGMQRLSWNGLMAIAAGLAAFGSIWSVWSKVRWYGIGAVGIFIGLAIVVQIMRVGRSGTSKTSG